jgi:PEP-CTERM motif
MKKLVLTTVCALVVSGAAFAAGNLNWGSAPFGSITAVTNTSSSPLFGGTGVGGVSGATGSAANSTYIYELLYNTFSGSQATIPSLTSLLQWQDTALTATNSNTAGRLTVVNPNSGAAVPWSPGVTDSIVLVGWSANLGFTWGTVSNILRQVVLGNNAPLIAALGGSQGFFGVSTTGYTTTFSTATSPGAAVFGAPTTEGLPIVSLNTPLFLVNPVPEPATMALAGLGGLSLLLFRRQRK